MKGLTLMMSLVPSLPLSCTPHPAGVHGTRVHRHWHSALGIAPKETRVPGSLKVEGGLRFKGTELGRASGNSGCSRAIG